MSTITKERIELFIKSPLENGLTRGEQMELARIALASLEAEPVSQTCKLNDPSGNSPVTPDGWISCSEQMPSAGEQVLAYRPDAPESNDPLIKMATYVGGSAHGHGFDCYCKPTHWMPLPAAPQEVNRG